MEEPDETEEPYEAEYGNDTIWLMTENLFELKGFFKMSKLHANLSFGLAFGLSIFGALLLAYAAFSYVNTKDMDMTVIPTVSGAIVELFAGTTLLIHKKSSEQLNHYHSALHENEKFLSTVNLVSKLDYESQIEMYKEIIRSQLINKTENNKPAEENENEKE